MLETAKRKIEEMFEKRTFLLIFLAFIIFTALTISRRPDVILNPGFYAEDGVFWYSEAYSAENPIEPFLVPKQGYYQTISRIGGFISQFFNILNAPLVFNIIAILIQILPAMLLISSRFNKIIPSLLARCALGLLYIGLLGTAEVHTNLTNAQWHLALVMLMVVIADNRQHIYWKIFDFLVLFVAGLSGPFVFVMFPLALIYSYKNFFKRRVLNLCVLGLAFLIQMHSLLFVVSDATRSDQPLNATLLNFFKIITGNVFLRGILGPDYVKDIRGYEFWINGFIPIVFGLLSISLLVKVFINGNKEMKFLLAFSFAILTAGLISPQVSLVKPQWDVMTGGSGGRYYFLATLAWMIAVVWLYFNVKQRFLKIIAGTFLVVYILIGLPDDWKFTKYKNYDFKKQVVEFEAIDIGKPYVFRIHPKWEMTLIKK